MQELPRCFGCQDVIEHDPIFEPPCGQEHQCCPSAVWHPLCLMRHREDLEYALRAIEAALERLRQSHGPNWDEAVPND